MSEERLKTCLFVQNNVWKCGGGKCNAHIYNTALTILGDIADEKDVYLQSFSSKRHRYAIFQEYGIS